MTVLASSGSLAFTSAFIPGSAGAIDWTATSLLLATNPFATLDALVAARGTATVGVSSGEIVAGAGTPEVIPLPGALPLFATGLAALGLLGWRRKRKAAA